MGIRKLGGDNTEKTKLQTYVQIMRIKKMTERGTSYDSNKNRQILFRNAPYLPPLPPPIFFISLGYYSRPKRNLKKSLCKIFWVRGSGGQIGCIMKDVQLANA